MTNENYRNNEAYKTHEPHEAYKTHNPYEAHETNGLNMAQRLFALAFLVLLPLAVSAQITIGGNVYGGGEHGKVVGDGNVTVKHGRFNGNIYGGGNLGELEGKTIVKLQGGDFHGGVFGGARMSNIGKFTFVNIDGANQLHDITANFVYGGNDISGHIGDKLREFETAGTLETEITMPFTPEVNTEAVGTEGDANYVPAKTLVDKSWQSYMLITPERSVTTGEGNTAVTTQYHTFIGQMFGGGNGEYTYPESADTNGKWIIKEQNSDVVVSSFDFQPVKPIVDKTYLQVNGGTYGYVFAGGNAATVTQSAVISINNSSEVTHSTDALAVSNYTDIRNFNTDDLNNPVDTRLLAMKLNLSTFDNNFHFINVFGGNNKADMSIRPVWNIHKGSIHNLYSGGNEGRMTHNEGILLEIEETSEIIVDNVYGGCRKSDVRPLFPSGEDVPTLSIQLSDTTYKFPRGFSARVLVRGGDVNNVYGGNDISGNVWGGNAVGIYTCIRGSVYGGGNGSYAYTDNPDLKNDIIWGDFYYNPDEVLAKAGLTASSKKLKSVEALNAFRPNSEQISIRLYGKDENHLTVVGKNLFIGGNSATVKPQSSNPIENPQVHLKIGSYSEADYVYFGNNGEQMVDASFNGVLVRYAGGVYRDNKSYCDFSSLDLTDEDIFAKYMEGCAMYEIPSVVFDSKKEGDPDDYKDYTAIYGSIYGGGNRGSMILKGTETLNFTHHIIVYEKLVGGCNNANIPEQFQTVGTTPNQKVNARFEGGIMTADANGNISPGPTVGDKNTPIPDKLVLNLSGVNILPMRWKTWRDENYETIYNADGSPKYLFTDEEHINEYHSYQLEWNTIDERTGKEIAPPTTLPQNGTSTDDDLFRRLKGGNVYGGCYQSGHVDGNVVININGTIHNRWDIFDKVTEDEGEAKLYENDTYHIEERHSGVILDEQGMDVLGTALNVFGGGYGEDSEIWGSTTINMNRGYSFQIFGGGEHGAVGKGKRINGKLEYNTYDPRFSTTINMNGPIAGVRRGDPADKDYMASTEFIYGGGFEGTVIGDTRVYLGNGRIFNSFAGSCNADILGHTETYIGLNSSMEEGFPWVRDHVYGGNDLGGRILGSKDFTSRIREDVNGIKSKLRGSTVASAYTEYVQGRVEYIFGGHYGDYDYTDPLYKEYFYEQNGTGTTDANIGTARPGYYKPFLDNAFVNFRPNGFSENIVQRIYGAGQGHTAGIGINEMQDRSYVLIDCPDSIEHNFEDMSVFGAGSWSGVGMRATYNTAKDSIAASATATAAAYRGNFSATIDLFRGKIKNVYGASFNEGVTRRTEINVPTGSTIRVENIFGGAYGNNTYLPCDVYESNVNFGSSSAFVTGAIYGGNNNERRTLYGHVNITAPVHSSPANLNYMSTVYGAGLGSNTWNEYTEVNLENGAVVYEVYGGGREGKVQNAESIQKIINTNKFMPSTGEYSMWPSGERAGQSFTDADRKAAWLLGSDYDPASLPVNDANSTAYVGNPHTNLSNPLTRTARMDDRETKTYKYNTNVLIKEGASVVGYAYGGGLGKDAYIAGSTYIALLGGTVKKDIYAAGTSGSVEDQHEAKTFIASANAYIEGGTARNVYGGGWKGSVGHHDGVWMVRKDKNGNDEDYIVYGTDMTHDIDGETHVVIGKLDGTSFIDGIPAIERNAYGGGEGGAVFGTSHITLNKGYVGYRYMPATNTYEEKIDDETWEDGVGANRLHDSGCIFGGGYVDNSSVDITNVKMYGGHVRNALFGGGEIAAIGRGTVTPGTSGNTVDIHRAGRTSLELYGGNVDRNVFGGGRGYNNLGEHGSLNSDGYVFGHTEVHIHGGEIGTDDGVAKEYGNVFGGGDIGYVYGAYYDKNGNLCRSKKSGERYVDGDEGYYYRHNGTKFTDENDNILTEGAEKVKTEDCRVLVEPHCRVLSKVTIDNKEYNEGEYVPTEQLNKMQTKGGDARWASLDPAGIIIHNAVFAGGNTSSGSASVYANTTTVFGNATASIHDVYHRDLITLGTGHVGGLYGDGNLTLVDGYRGLNITNYGTDYYSIEAEITLDEYRALPAREAAYYELKYKCIQECTDDDGTTYTPADPNNENSKASTLTADDILALFKNGTHTPNMIIDGKPNPYYWTENGVLPVYAGRPMNTIQRADFCGVWGSRMVMQGAQDRVPEVVDYTNYTINRVREVSLNKKVSTAGDALGSNGYQHGNYFGIYNIVNHLGALTSDVDFGDEGNGSAQGDVGTGDVRTTDNTRSDFDPQYTGQTFFGWKKSHIKDRMRNNGNSHNKVALASGVYLELTTEKSTGTGLREKDWGYITGVIELDLINVQPGVGGGFVYAKNVHGKRIDTHKQHTTITDLNRGAVSKDHYTYSTSDADKDEWQTSGNFVHSTLTIIDECYNISGKYKGSEEEAVPAHYWFIKGSVYVYDQYISAYTGVPNAYSEKVEIPLIIAAASHGTMKLLNIQPNRYAFWKSDNNELASDGKLVINDVTYEKNDPINFWDWSLMSANERKLFEAETYVVKEDCWVGASETLYKAGTVLKKSDYDTLKAANPTVKILSDDGVTKTNADFEFVFRSSNNLSHDTGYILTYEVNNPKYWNTWYTKFDSDTQEKLSTDTYANQDGYNNGPTYRLRNGITASVLGQRDYDVSNLISKDVFDTYKAITEDQVKRDALPSGQATFEEAYLVTETVTYNDGTGERHLYPGSVVSATEAETSALSGKTSPAYICTHTIQLGPTDYIYLNTRMTESERQAYLTQYDSNTTLKDQIADNIVPAYYCTSAGLYGGDYYEGGKNYRGLEAWCSMSNEDRQKFTFNYDALDLLIDPTYSGSINPTSMAQYDGTTSNPAGYSETKPVDYTASYEGTTDLSLSTAVAIIGKSGTYTTLTKGDELDRENFESIPNERRHYSGISVTDELIYYIVNTPFQIGNTPYAVGTILSADAYNNLSDKSPVTKLTFTEDDKNKKFFFCREQYVVGTAAEGGQSVTNYANVTGTTVTGTYTYGQTVPIGLVIDETTYNNLINKQADFTIHGISPTETTTLYVSRNSDIFDLSTEKIITVIYQYDYEESDAQGNITPVTERHVVNIHIQFKSGIPTVEDIKAPQIIIPGTYVSLIEPFVTPGAYEVSGGGWELFEKRSDAESHTNGIDYTPNVNPLYWYQNGYYVAYYAKTYLGKTYSNAVSVSVANYHDLKRVMDDTENHYFIDNLNVDREPKIYINDYSKDNVSGIQLFKNLIDLTHVVSQDASGNPVAISGGALDGHMPLNLTHTQKPMRGGEYLEFFLQADQSLPDGTTWTPVANDVNTCFNGRFHGDGHTISGLDHSLFNHLCGDVYNLGVTGTFTGAGIAETGEGYMENCWAYTTSTKAKTSKPVFGNPTITPGDQSTRPVRMVNCYYLEDDNAATTAATDDATKFQAYTNHNGTYGTPTRKPEQSFYNGEVTYDLNGFYLNKRFYDSGSAAATTALGSTPKEYKFYNLNTDGSIPYDTNTETTVTATGYYPEYDSDNVQYGNIGYVESRFEDGDFIYAGGTIPESANERLHVESGTSAYYPIWPDDYIFFGQILSYGHENTRPHQPLPSTINKSGGRLATAAASINRVYRAPAYFRSKEMSIAHYNPYAIFAHTSADNSHTAYPFMTAIDFTGYSDPAWTRGTVNLAGTSGNQAFYPPLLDNDGITRFRNIDLTSNLLVYTHAATSTATDAKSKTFSSVNTALNEPVYNETNTNYRNVAEQDAGSVHGHHVVLGTGGYTARKDQLLVDKYDFNAPIEYTFASGKRMFYQRNPDTFVETTVSGTPAVRTTTGWEGVSLPFSAELVTTQQKGEITHFYSNSEESKNNTHTKLGHEYWLRGFADGGSVSPTDANVYVAKFVYPDSPAANTTLTGFPEADWSSYKDKNYTNTFLWDYYYKFSSRRDRNTDKYQEYYKTAHTHNSYAYATAATPYIIGLPSDYYYEFDLSGNFKPVNTFQDVSRLDPQVITFVSAPGTTIKVSDDELATAATANTHDSYTFRANYLGKTVDPAAGTTDYYTLKDDGGSYLKATAATATVPFRPYFTYTDPNPANRRAANEIQFSNISSTIGGGEDQHDELAADTDGRIIVKGKRGLIIVKSTLNSDTTVSIVSASGIVIRTFDIAPGATVETEVVSGVYIVNKEKIYIK